MTRAIRRHLGATIVALCLLTAAHAYAQPPGTPPAPFDTDPIAKTLGDPAKTETEIVAFVVDGLRERIRAARLWADDRRDATKDNDWGRYYEEGWDLAVFIAAAMKPRTAEQRNSRIDALEAAWARLRDDERTGPLGTCLDIAQAAAGGRNARVDAALVRAVLDRDAPRKILAWALGYMSRDLCIDVLPRLLELTRDDWEAQYGMHGEGNYFPIRSAAIECLKTSGIKVLWRRDSQDGYVKVFDLNYSDDKYAQVDRAGVLSVLKRALESDDDKSFVKGVAASKQIAGTDVKELLLALSKSEAFTAERRRALASAASEIR